jgi:hypothetical protein
VAERGSSLSDVAELTNSNRLPLNLADVVFDYGEVGGNIETTTFEFNPTVRCWHRAHSLDES